MCETIYKDEQFTHVLFINKQKQLLFNNFLFVQRRVFGRLLGKVMRVQSTHLDIIYFVQRVNVHILFIHIPQNNNHNGTV